MKLKYINSKLWENLTFNEFDIDLEYIEINKDDYMKIVKQRKGQQFLNSISYY